MKKKRKKMLKSQIIKARKKKSWQVKKEKKVRKMKKMMRLFKIKKKTKDI